MAVLSDFPCARRAAPLVQRGAAAPDYPQGPVFNETEDYPEDYPGTGLVLPRHLSGGAQSGRILPDSEASAQETGRKMFDIKLNSRNFSKKCGLIRHL
ncbi:hypothetical protein F2P45_10020 [Massilia sp. CCM 8733]|uniref:Uncharacterized protein n=1 Tax=Massilia mucilaginosa TaxID=2609282 RepID=A0ABX0NR90_9BURK|nr:hypothetical protein [Massilia mucilaginosa]NHZ89347.1 hypothetical protein [Massilia mucilaginosa]